MKQYIRISVPAAMERTIVKLKYAYRTDFVRKVSNTFCNEVCMGKGTTCSNCPVHQATQRAISEIKLGLRDQYAPSQADYAKPNYGAKRAYSAKNTKCEIWHSDRARANYKTMKGGEA